MSKIEIITIGDEILIGQIVDTNSAWMATELNKFGFEIAQITSVHDNAEHIVTSLDAALKRADIVLFTGGIGPTKDDITKQTLCKYFNTKLVYNEEVYKNIEKLLINRQRAINELTNTQAFVPENCTVIQNTIGTAPITWFEKEGKVIVSMPGVPSEMKLVMSKEIIPRLQTKFVTSSIIHKTVIVSGYPESALAIKIADWENNLPSNIHLAYLPHFGIVKLRLSAYSNNKGQLEATVDEQISSLSQILNEAIVAYEDKALEVIIGDILRSNSKTLGTAESCTGGHIAHKITSVSGSSEYYKGSIISYSNEIKENILHVPAQIIEQFGAVSQEVVEKMATEVRKILNVDYCIATSGIAGPTGGSNEKPVGTIWISACSKDRILSRKYVFGKNRLENIERFTQTAFLLFKEFLGDK